MVFKGKALFLRLVTFGFVVSPFSGLFASSLAGLFLPSIQYAYAQDPNVQKSPKVAIPELPPEFKSPTTKELPNEFAKSLNPSNPETLPVLQPIQTFNCKRQIEIDGRTMECDSARSLDAERLRPYLSKDPIALKYLENYQSKRKSLKWLVIPSSLGLFCAFGGIISAEFYRDPTLNDRLNLTGISLRNVGLISGVTLIGGAILTGITISLLGEHDLQMSISQYNQSYPDHAIKVEFKKFLFF